jgi:hypothetical protein
MPLIANAPAYAGAQKASNVGFRLTPCGDVLFDHRSTELTRRSLFQKRR